jgi:hypothetical protein
MKTSKITYAGGVEFFGISDFPGPICLPRFGVDTDGPGTRSRTDAQGQRGGRVDNLDERNRVIRDLERNDSRGRGG